MFLFRFGGLSRICSLPKNAQSKVTVNSLGYTIRSQLSKAHFATSPNISVVKAKTDQRKNPGESFGQPTAWTHPHIVKEGEICRGVRVEEFLDRRRRLMESIQSFALNLNAKLKNHVVMIPSATKKYMSDKIPYVFRQNSDFFYLTGCLEPDSTLMLCIDEKGTTKSILFVRPKDKHAELWDGNRTGVTNAPEFFGVEEAHSTDGLRIFLERYVKSNQPVTIWHDKKESDQPKVTEVVQSCIDTLSPSTSESPTLFIQKLRLIKSPAEIELMRQSCEIASQSINETMRETRPGDLEHHIFARVDYKCRMRNASFLAYPPVVASGRNATTIHYINNTQIVNNGDLVLMDAGCEFGGYSSDITRTWPVNGEFTPVQKELYELLQTLQKDLLNTLLKEGGRTLDELFDTMCLKLGKYLQEIGLIPKGLKNLDLAKMAYNFCPHHVSHYLGMDVHDTPLISRSNKLIPGMICTVEPGIYIAADRTDVPEEFRGIGMRIEDDVLIKSNDSIEVLTQNCVKDLTSIENLFK